MRIYDRSHPAIDVRVGEPFQLRLDAIPAAGYVWIPEPVEGLDVSDAQFSSGPAKSIGGGFAQSFIVKASHPGSFRLRFNYKRPWEPQPEDSAEFRIVASRT